MTITNDYIIGEKLKTLIRAACPNARVFLDTPTMLNKEEFDKLMTVTVESCPLAYAWIIADEGVAAQGHGTMSQREAVNWKLYGYMVHADRPGLPHATDPGQKIAFASGTATGGSTTTLVDSGAAWTVNAYANTHEVWITYADGTLDHARILSNTATTLALRADQSLKTAASAGCAYEIWLRPTEHILHEEARALLNSLTTNRSNVGSAITGSLGGYVFESVIWYDLGMWRVTFTLNRDLFPSKSFA